MPRGMFYKSENLTTFQGIKIKPSKHVRNSPITDSK